MSVSPHCGERFRQSESVICGQPPGHTDSHHWETPRTPDMDSCDPHAITWPNLAPRIRAAFEAGYLAREQSMSLHTLGMQSSDQAERDQAFTRWQQARSNR